MAPHSDPWRESRRLRSVGGPKSLATIDNDNNNNNDNDNNNNNILSKKKLIIIIIIKKNIHLGEHKPGRIKPGRTRLPHTGLVVAGQNLSSFAALAKSVGRYAPLGFQKSL